MTDLHNDNYDDDAFYEDDSTDEEDGRGSSKLLETSKSVRKPKRVVKAFTGQASMQTHRSDKRMTRRGEGRVQSSKRRQQMSLRNQYTELTINYDELLKENKLLKQIQKRQERELDRFTNTDEDLPRLLDANNYEIAGLKVKNKQLLFEKREQDDKLRRQHQEIVTLKEQNKKMTTLANNRKLGEREKLEMELTTARVTIAHQENKIQDLTKAVEIYKKTADREVKGNTLQLKKAQHNLRDLQDAYNELFLKYKAQEKELSNQNIYAQRGRLNSKRSKIRTGYNSQPNLAVNSYHSLSKNSTPAVSERKAIKQDSKPESQSFSNIKSSSLERLESELELLNKQSDSLADLEKVLEEEAKESLAVPNTRPKSASTLGSDSEDDLDDDIEDTAPDPPPSKQPLSEATSPPPVPAVESEPVEPAPVKPDTPVVDNTAAESKRLAEEALRIAGENEEKKNLEEEARKEEARRVEHERKLQEEKARVEEKARKKEAEEKAAREEEQRLLKEKKKKDDALKDKLAAVRKNAGGEDFMSQLKAKKNTPTVSPAQSVKSEVKSPPAAVTTERQARKSGSGDDLRKAAAINNANSRRRKSIDEDLTSGYQPSFVAKPTAGKTDPFGVEIVNDVGEYTPSFSNNQRISRESVNKDKVWTPTGRASTSERNGLFDSSLDQKPLLKRRPSKSKNNIPVKTYEQDDDLEELLL